jgi:carbon storage regulator
MLVLTRKVGSSIVIDGQIKIQVVQIKGRQVRLGIEAPKETKVHREEVQKRSIPESRERQSSDCVSL